MVRFRFSCVVEPMKLSQLVAVLYDQELTFDPEVKIDPHQQKVPFPRDLRPALKEAAMREGLARKGTVRRDRTIREHSLRRVDVLESYMRSGPKTYSEMGEALEMAGFRKGSLANMLGPLQRAGRLVNNGGLWEWKPKHAEALA